MPWSFSSSGNPGGFNMQSSGNPGGFKSDIITAGLVLFLDAGNPASYPGTGTTWTDLSGNGNTGTLVGPPTFDSANGGSLVFNGSSHYVDCGFATSTRSSNVSYEVWIRFSVSQTGRTIMALHRDNLGGFALGIHDNFANRIKLHTNTIGANTGNGILGTATLNDNRWYCVTGTYDSASTTLQLYVNGVLDRTLVGPTTPVYPSDRNLNIGRWTGAGTQYFNGRIANCKIYNRALSAVEVLHNFNITRGRFGV